jgi:pimeloyl-ACP methyl ester carboxylesterase
LGAVTVVFEAGLGGSASEWIAVQRAVSERCRTVAYDRAGYGGSDDVASPRDLAALVDDLESLIGAIGVSGPLILVGHSWGGGILRALASRSPHTPGALVIVDGAEVEAMSTAYARFSRGTYALFAMLSRVGLQRPVMTALLARNFRALDEADRKIMLESFFSARDIRAGHVEARELVEGFQLLRGLKAQGLPSLPVTVIVGALSDPWAPKVRRAMIEAGRKEMEGHSRGRFVLASSSSHFVPQQQPDLVAEEILQVARALDPANA